MNWWGIIKNRPVNIPESLKQQNPVSFLYVNDMSKEKWVKDDIGFSKYTELIELAGKYNLEDSWIYTDKDENGNIIPMFWNNSTGWNMNELDNEITNLQSRWGESGYKEYTQPLPSNPNVAPPPPK